MAAVGEPEVSDGREGAAVADAFPTRYLPRPEVRPMPDAPTDQWRLIGPGIIAAGVGLASGEFILFPYIASQVGLVFVWAAMVGLARSWAAELAPRGITVNVVAPGATETPMLMQPGRASSPPKLPPMGRYIQPQEVADLVGYLLSPSAAAITGQELVICGGASL